MAISVPANSLFASTRGIAVNTSGDAVPEISVRAEPTKDYGVGLARIRFGSASYSSNPPNDQHLVWLHHSEPVPVIIGIAGRRSDHTPGPGSLCVYPAEADSTCEAMGPGEGLTVRVSAECTALAGAQLARHGGTIVERKNAHDDMLFQIGQRLEAEAAAGHPNGMLFWSSAADAFIRHMTAHHLSTSTIEPRGAVGAHALKRLDAYILANLGEPLDLKELAAVIDCERFHFAHRFRATVGMAPHRYVMRLRVDRACGHIRAGSVRWPRSPPRPASPITVTSAAGSVACTTYGRKISEVEGEELR